MKNSRKKITTYFVILSLLVIGVVYAILQANLQINGIAKIKSNSWDIHFDNVQINNDSVSIGTGDSPATIDPENNCKVDFEVTLSTPGDFYEFTVDVVNAGTIDGMIGELNKTLRVNNEVVSEIPDYLNYIVTYEDGSEILQNHLLEAGETLTYLVRLEFKTDIEELPNAATINTSLEPQYIQADTGAIKKLPYYACTFDGELVQGAEYTNGQYTYRYMQQVDYYYTGDNETTWGNISSDGWGVHLSDPSSTDSVTSRLCTSINNKPIVSMRNMFYNSLITSIDTSSFDTSHVENMYGMFEYTNNITELDLTSFDVSNVTNMNYMFLGTSYNASSFRVNLKNWNPINVTTMEEMFAYSGYNATTWEIEGDISNWNLSKVTSLERLFEGAGGSGSSITLDLSNWDVSHVTNMRDAFNMFGKNAFSVHLNLSNWNVSSVTTFYNMFYYLGYSATSIDIGNLSKWNVSSATTFQNMFRYIGNNCNDVSVGGLSTWNISPTANVDGMFAYTCYTSGYMNIGTINVLSNNISYMFNYANLKGNVNIKANPSSYYSVFYDTSTHAGSGITVNYTSSVTNIDSIIATKTSSSNVVKGSLISS